MDVQLVEELGSMLLRSQFVTPKDIAYHDAIARWNAAAQRPAGLVVFAVCTEDVVAALRFARANNLDVAVRGGGHFSGPASSSDGGLVIDLRRLNRCFIDTDKKVLRVGGGAVWGDIDQYTTHHGLAAVVGTASRTGMGAALGGGYGWLTGSHGLALDNIVSARVVTADGSVVDCSETSHPDLFWALRGAGPSFGVAVEISLRLHAQDWCVFAGSLAFPLERADDVIDALNALVPDPTGRASATLALSNITPAPSATRPAAVVTVFYNGSESAGRRFFAPLYALSPAADSTSAIPFLKLNTLGDEPRASLGRRQTMAGTRFRAPLDKALFNAAREDYEAFVRAYGGHGVAAEVIFEFHNMAKVAAVPHDATSFPNRGNYQNVFAWVSWADPALDRTVEEFAGGVRDQLRWKYQNQTQTAAAAAGLVNGMGMGMEMGGNTSGLMNGRVMIEEKGTGWYANYNGRFYGKIPASVVFGDHYARLQELKAKYDPQNVFNKWYAIEPKFLADGNMSRH